MTREEEIKNFANNEYKCIGSETDYTSTAAYEGIIKGAKWADETMIAKAVRWLKDQEEMIGISFEEDFLERFKEAMEE